MKAMSGVHVESFEKRNPRTTCLKFLSISSSSSFNTKLIWENTCGWSDRRQKLYSRLIIRAITPKTSREKHSISWFNYIKFFDNYSIIILIVILIMIIILVMRCMMIPAIRILMTQILIHHNQIIWKPKQNNNK